jgi:hypothetical protein
MGIVALDSPQMHECAVAVTARQLELRQPKQGILGLRRQRVIDDNVAIIALGIRSVRRE